VQTLGKEKEGAFVPNGSIVDGVATIVYGAWGVLCFIDDKEFGYFAK
jgi:hypothetical protein